jgi:hypothetical protein
VGATSPLILYVTSRWWRLHVRAPLLFGKCFAEVDRAALQETGKGSRACTQHSKQAVLQAAVLKDKARQRSQGRRASLSQSEVWSLCFSSDSLPAGRVIVKQNKNAPGARSCYTNGCRGVLALLLRTLPSPIRDVKRFSSVAVDLQECVGQLSILSRCFKPVTYCKQKAQAAGEKLRP